jgi:hypothetical protein
VQIAIMVSLMVIVTIIVTTGIAYLLNKLNTPEG